MEWQRTGILPGDALRNYAAVHWAGHHDPLQMAERDTSAQAMQWIAKWGTPPAVAGEPVAWRHRMGPTDIWVECSKEFHDWVVREPSAWPRDEVQALCLAAPQPTQAVPPAGREPLTNEQILNRENTGSNPGTASYDLELARFVEAAHGIKVKEAGNADT